MSSETDFTFDREWDLFVDGEFRPASDAETLAVENPATGEFVASAPDGTAEDIDEAVVAAGRAFEEWQWVEPRDRAELMYEIADRIEECHDELVALETIENGKPLDQSANDVNSAAKTFRYFAGGADKFYSDSVKYAPDETRQKVFEPYGVAGIVIPWNWPPMHTADFTAVALAAGNTVVLKPAPETPLSSLRIAELAADVLPDGVFNVVTGGTEPGVALTSHEDVDMIAFTGHDETGEHVLEAAAEHITPTMLELGGKNPAIVFPDVDIEKTVQDVLVATFYNSGQACSDAERLLIHEDIYDEFLGAFADAVSNLVVGDGREESTQIGPVINRDQVEKFHRYLDVAQSEGSEVIAQAETPDDPATASGHWVPPTLLDGVEPDDRFAQEEVFGPVAGAMPFSDEEEAIEIANNVEYGLTATIWTKDISRAHRLASQLKVGGVGINTTAGGDVGVPFGGYKRSGIGRKKDFEETMRCFTQVKSVQVDQTDEPSSL